MYPPPRFWFQTKEKPRPPGEATPVTSVCRGYNNSMISVGTVTALERHFNESQVLVVLCCGFHSKAEEGDSIAKIRQSSSGADARCPSTAGLVQYCLCSLGCTLEQTEQVTCETMSSCVCVLAEDATTTSNEAKMIWRQHSPFGTAGRTSVKNTCSISEVPASCSSRSMALISIAMPPPPCPPPCTASSGSYSTKKN